MGSGWGRGLGGVFAEYLPSPLRTPFLFHLVAIALAIVLIATLPETVTVRSHRKLTLRLEVPPEDRRVFWTVLVPSGMLFSLFDGVCLSLIPVFEVRELHVTNYVLVGAAGFLVLVSGAVSQIIFTAASLPPRRSRGASASRRVAFIGVVIGAPLRSPAIVLSRSRDDRRRLRPGVQRRNRPVHPHRSAGGSRASSSRRTTWRVTSVGSRSRCSIVGVLADLIGLTTALAVLTGVAALASAWTALVGPVDRAFLRPQDDVHG